MKIILRLLPALFALSLLISFSAHAEITCDTCFLGPKGSVEASCDPKPRGDCTIQYRNMCNKKNGALFKPGVGGSFLKKVNSLLKDEFPKCYFDFANPGDRGKAEKGEKVRLKPRAK